MHIADPLRSPERYRTPVSRMRLASCRSGAMWKMRLSCLRRPRSFRYIQSRRCLEDDAHLGQIALGRPFRARWNTRALIPQSWHR